MLRGLEFPSIHPSIHLLYLVSSVCPAATELTTAPPCGPGWNFMILKLKY